MHLGTVVYCTRSPYKMEEWEAVKNVLRLTEGDQRKLGEHIAIEFRKIPTSEPLLCDLQQMVIEKSRSAYQAVKVPCVVEHAGLILEGYEDYSFPGGLTQPMWDALGAERFLLSCTPLANKVIARAIIAYCDGLTIKTFVGETPGTLSDEPRGDRDFYWDTVFCPDGFNGQTYAEIASSDLIEKLKVSQSIKALKKFIAFRSSSQASLFPDL